MKDTQQQKLFRTQTGGIREALSTFEGIAFQEDPLDFFIVLARYKFAIRQLKKTDVVLDAGCGPGYGAVFLSKFAGRVVGGDVDAELVQRNQKAFSNVPNLSFKELDLQDSELDCEPFDVVVSMDVIEHFEEDQADGVVANYARLTKDKGFALIGTPNIASRQFASQRRLDSHPKEYSPEEFTALLERHYSRVFLFSMTDEAVSTGFPKMAWYLMALCVK
jgi:2-polyprenyl-3-methyl-5-hydroxy-6-metoxy-1,4-benzoquinol methylase